MVELGVNIDHVATLRQARGTPYPDPVQAAYEAEQAGADLITLHLREDRRHIQERDVELLRRTLSTRMNLEIAATAEMVAIARRVGPDDVCLVPERREELTTEGGLDVVSQAERMAEVCAALQGDGIRVSLFVDPEPGQVRASAAAGARAVEIHTGRFADAAGAERQGELERIRAAVAVGRECGLRVNAGHGLHYHNVQPIAALEGVAELNIGHAIVARAVFAGLAEAVRQMKSLIAAAGSARLSAP